MAQAESKLVKCEICGKQFHARGLHGHLRMKHQVVPKKVTKVVFKAPKPYTAFEEENIHHLSPERQREVREAIMSKLYGSGPDRDMSDEMRQQRRLREMAMDGRESRLFRESMLVAKVIEQTVTYKPVKVAAGRFSKVITRKK